MLTNLNVTYVTHTHTHKKKKKRKENRRELLEKTKSPFSDIYCIS